MLPPIRTLSDHEIQHEQMGLARLNDGIIVPLPDLNSRPAAGIFGKGVCLITTPTYKIFCESNDISWTSRGSGPIADRPSAALFGAGTWQDGSDLYSSDEVSWSVLGITTSYDVVIYGATPGGIMAAIAAKKEGATVAIFEPTNRIGGMASGGLSWFDINNIRSPAAIVGLSRDFIEELADYYGVSFTSFWFTTPNPEPKVVLHKFKEWLARHDIPVFYGNELVSVLKSGTEISKAIFSKDGAINGKVFIDSTYEGDLLASAGCSYFIGREANATYGETNNGVMPIISTHNFVNPVDPYVTPGNSASGLLKYAGSGLAPATVGTTDGNVMAMCYRLIVTNAADKVPFPEPDNYNPQDYELLGRHVVANGSGWTYIGDVTGRLGVRESKFDLNSNGAFSLDYIDPVCSEYITATWGRRRAIQYEIQQYTLGWLKFLMTDTRVPVALRTNIATYGFAADEFQDDGGFSSQLYVREGRRLVGDFVLVEPNITAINAYADPVSYIYYVADTHNCQRVVVGGNIKNEGLGVVAVAVGAKIPYRVLLPKVTECTNLLVTFAGSMSHVAFSSVRMEPTHMGLGQAAGIAAAIAIESSSSVQAIDVATLLLRQNVTGEPYGIGISLSVDGSHMNGTIDTVGTWIIANVDFGFYGSNYAVSSETGATKKFNPAFKETGQYRVYLNYPNNTANPRSQVVPVTVAHAYGTTAISLNQNLSAVGNHGSWIDIGTYTFIKNAANYVLVGTDGLGVSSVISGVKFERV